MKFQQLIILLAGLLISTTLTAQIPRINFSKTPRPPVKPLKLKPAQLPPGYATEMFKQGFRKVWAQLPGIGNSVPIQVKPYGENYLFEGDIIIRPWQLTSTSESQPSRDREFQTRQQGLYGEANTLVDGEYLWLWQYGTIPYTIASDVPQGLRRKIFKAMDSLRVQSSGYLKLIPRTNQEDYVVFQWNRELKAGGRSCLGRVGDAQEIELGLNISVGSIMHEMLHAAGVFHEHTRPDRNYYINIEWTHIRPGAWNNFTMLNTVLLGKTYTPYDYYSIMHYGPTIMGRVENGRQLTIIIPLRALDGQMGQRKGLSEQDRIGIKRMYGRQKWYVSEDGKGQWVALNSSAVRARDLAGGDFNGDGLTDLMRTSNGKWYVSYSGVSDWEVLNTSDIPREELMFGDFNGDGRTDVFHANGREWKVSYSGSSPWRRINKSSVRKNRLQVGDFNADGEDDIFYASGSQWKVSYSGRSKWRFLNTSQTTKSKLILGDFDGDDYTDVLVTTGRVWRISYKGSSTWLTLNQSAITKPNLMWSDFNGDGNTDLFYANGREWKLSYSGRTQWYTVNKSAIRKADLKTGNFDGDGLSDIFGSWDD